MDLCPTLAVRWVGIVQGDCWRGSGRYRDLYRVREGVGWRLSPLGWERGCYSPGRLLRGSGTVSGLTLGWVGSEMGWWVSLLGWQVGWDSPERLFWGLRRYRDLHAVEMGWCGLMGTLHGPRRDCAWDMGLLVKGSVTVPVLYRGRWGIRGWGFLNGLW